MAATELTRIRVELDRLRRQQERVSDDVVRRCSKHAMQQTVVLCALADVQVALEWVRHKQRVVCRRWGGVPEVVDDGIVQTWQQALAEDPDVCRCLADIEHPWRFPLQQHMLEVQVKRKLDEQHRKGCRVPPGALLRWYINGWQEQGQSRSARLHLTSLTATTRTAAKNWLRQFRKRWGIAWSRGSPQRCLDQASIRDRVAIFLRWARWLWLALSARGPVIVLNIDETPLGNIRGTAKGLVPRTTLWTREEPRSTPEPRNLPRTTLLAALASDAEVQRVLPQIRCPRSSAERWPSAAQRAMYALAGAPCDTWHGTTGWLNTRLFVLWLDRLRRAVRRIRPDAEIILCMDCCPSHTSEEACRACQRYRIHPLFVAARLTWLLQPLDVRVFANVKNSIRKKTVEKCMASPHGEVTVAETVQIHAEAIHHEIVNKAWTSLFQKCGLLGPEHALRKELADVSAGMDLAARKPTACELQRCLQISEARACQLWHQLLLPLPAAEPAHAAASASGAAEVPAVPARADSTGLVIHAVRVLPAPQHASSRPLATNLWVPGARPGRARPLTRRLGNSSVRPGEAASSNQ